MASRRRPPQQDTQQFIIDAYQPTQDQTYEPAENRAKDCKPQYKPDGRPFYFFAGFDYCLSIAHIRFVRNFKAPSLQTDKGAKITTAASSLRNNGVQLESFELEPTPNDELFFPVLQTHPNANSPHGVACFGMSSSLKCDTTPPPYLNSTTH